MNFFSRKPSLSVPSDGIDRTQPIPRNLGEQGPFVILPKDVPLSEYDDCVETAAQKRNIGLIRQINQLSESASSLAAVKTLVFMRLNAARDRRDKKAITILEEIMEACR